MNATIFKNWIFLICVILTLRSILFWSNKRDQVMYTGGTMKIKNRVKTCSRLSERHWCFSHVLIEVADEPTCCFLFQNTTPAWPAWRHTNGKSRYIGTYARARSVGQFSSIPAMASSSGRFSIRCCTTPRTEWTEFAVSIDYYRLNVFF